MNKKNKYKFSYENIMEFVSREELFVFVIGLSKRRVTAEILYKYKDLIKELNLNVIEIIRIANIVSISVGR